MGVSGQVAALADGNARVADNACKGGERQLLRGLAKFLK